MKTVRVQMLLSPEESNAIDDWRFPRRIDSRSEAIRQLVKKGMNSPQEEAAPQEAAGFSRMVASIQAENGMSKEEARQALLKEVRATFGDTAEAQVGERLEKNAEQEVPHAE